MLRCINCGLCVQRIQRHNVSNLAQHLRAVLSNWLAVEEPADGVFVEHVTLCCLNALLTPLLEDLVTYMSALDVVAQYLPRVVTGWLLMHQYCNTFHGLEYPRCMYETCHSCWVVANRRQTQDIQRDPDNQLLVNEGPNVIHELIQDIPMPPPQPPVNPVSASVPRDPVVGSIVMFNYKRAANTSRYCIFRNCNLLPWFLIPTFIKKYMIKENNIYIPRSARVCRDHLYGNDWDTLPEVTTLVTSYDARQLEDLINILKSEKSMFDFERVEEMPNHICHYWTARTAPSDAVESTHGTDAVRSRANDRSASVRRRPIRRPARYRE
ncbi:hypothetical protein ACJJTC_018668 [Scirpophaga incertulas]